MSNCDNDPGRNARLPALIVLLGPTAVGKTGLSLGLAEALAGEIVSADSRLLYRGMDIGTAKPSAAEQARVLHHLIDVADPDEAWSLARYQEAAYRAIDAILGRGRVPILVGGTGQYIRSVVQGWQIPRQEPDPQLRQALEKLGRDIGPQQLHRRLEALDPAAAAEIDYRNLRRTVRAIEVIFRTGRPFSAQSRLAQPRYRCLQIGLIRPRAELYSRIDQRIDAMLAAGLVAEVSGLVARGYPCDLASMSAIGYREICRHLAGEISLEEAVAAIRKNTRTFVRRQANWFKPDDAAIHWLPAGDENLLSQLDELCQAFLDG